MVNPDDVLLMTEQEKLDLLRQVSDADEWQSCFEPLYSCLIQVGPQKTQCDSNTSS